MHRNEFLSTFYSINRINIDLFGQMFCYMQNLSYFCTLNLNNYTFHEEQTKPFTDYF